MTQKLSKQQLPSLDLGDIQELNEELEKRINKPATPGTDVQHVFKNGAMVPIDLSNQAEKSALEAHVNAKSGNPHDVTQNDVGLGNVDNTADTEKPVSQAQAEVLNLKVDKTVYNEKIAAIEEDIDDAVNDISTLSGQVAMLQAIGVIKGEVDTKELLDEIDTDKLPINTIYIVEEDETKDGETTRYTWNGTEWVYSGKYHVKIIASAVAFTPVVGKITSTDLQAALLEVYNDLYDTKQDKAPNDDKYYALRNGGLEKIPEPYVRHQNTIDLSDKLDGDTVTFALGEAVEDYNVFYNGIRLAEGPDASKGAFYMNSPKTSMTLSFTAPAEGESLVITFWK